MPIADRAVLIEWKEDGKPRVGSGIRIGGRNVLTADHCAAGAGHVVYIDREPRDATVLARSGTADVDIAILHVPTLPDVEPLKCARLDRSVMHQVTGCLALGYPRWMASDGRAQAQVSGIVPTAEGRTPRGNPAVEPFLSFKITDPRVGIPNVRDGVIGPRSAWAGMSGAAVVNSDNVVVGVVRSHNLEHGQMALTLTPITKITELAQPTSRKMWSALGVEGGRSLVPIPSAGRCVLLMSSGRNRASQRAVEQLVRDAIGDLPLDLEVRPAASGLAGLDEAELVIADLTNPEPAIQRSLFVAQGIGLPDVVIAEKGASALADKQLGAVEISLGARGRAKSRDRISARLDSIREVMKGAGYAANPITDYFKAPLTQISPAYGLALGYLINFIRPTSRVIDAWANGDSRFRLEIGGKTIRSMKGRSVRLTVVLPSSLEWANDATIAALTRTESLLGAKVGELDDRGELSRPRFMKAGPVHGRDAIELFDVFPTTLGAIIEAIDLRLFGKSGGERDHRWRTVERKEIDRFGVCLAKGIESSRYGVADRPLHEMCTVKRSADIFPSFDLVAASTPGL